MDRPAEQGHLNSEEPRRLQEYVDRFAQAWAAVKEPTGSVELMVFLPPRDDPGRVQVLHELIKIDLEMRWRRNQPIVLDRYLEQYAELGSARTLPARLVFEEYRVRQRYGDKPQAAIYQNRFPDQYDEFQQLLQRASQPTATAPVHPPSPGSASLPTPAGPQSFPGATQEGKEIGGGYRLVKRIGSGGFGEVWRATAPGGVEAAVKIVFRPLDNEDSQRELASLDLIKKLRHPFLLSTTAFWQYEDRLVIVMELADASLRDRLKECRKQGLPGIPVAELVRYFHGAAEALDYLHSEKVLHRDVKPDNILLLKRYPKVADFGLARVLPATQRSVMASGSGTPAYMAPEVWRGKVSPQSDQYALAATYAELRLERRLFSSRDLAEVMFDHLQRMPDLGTLPQREQEVLLRALAKDPMERYPTCVDFALALEDAVADDSGRRRASGLPPEASPGTTPSKKPPSDRTGQTRPLPASPPTRSAAVQPDPTHRAPEGAVALKGEVTPSSESREGAFGTLVNIDTEAKTPSGTPADLSQRLQAEVPGRPAKDEEVLHVTALPIADARQIFQEKEASTRSKGPPSRRAAPGWKSSEEETKAKRRLPFRKLAVPLVVVAALAGLAGGAYRHKQTIQHEVRPLLESQQFEEALERVEAGGVLLFPFRDRLRQEVFEPWYLEASSALKKGEFLRAAGIFQAIQDRFRGNTLARSGLEEALDGAVQQLLTEEQFEKAAALVQGTELREAATDALRAAVLRAWLKHAEQYLPRQQEEARQEATRILGYYAGNAEAQELLRRAEQGLLGQEVGQLLLKKQYREASALIDSRQASLDATFAQGLRERIAAGQAGLVSQLQPQIDQLLPRDPQGALKLVDSQGQQLTAEARLRLRTPIGQVLLRQAEQAYRDDQEPAAKKILSQILTAFADDPATREAAQALQAKYLKNTGIIPGAVAKLLKEGQESLDADPKGAADSFQRILVMSGITSYPQFWTPAKLGLARASARLEQWDQVKTHLGDLADAELEKQQAELKLVLEALQAHRQGPYAPELVGQLYALGKSTPELRDCWEARQLAALTRRVIQSFDLAAMQPEPATGLANQILLCEPDHVGALLFQGYQSWKEGDHARSRQLVAKVSAQGTMGPEKALVDALRGLLLASDPKAAAAERSQAGDLLRQRIVAGEPKAHLAAVYAAYLNLAESQQISLNDALATLDKYPPSDKALQGRIEKIKKGDWESRFASLLAQVSSLRKDGKLDEARQRLPELKALAQGKPDALRQVQVLEALLWAAAPRLADREDHEKLFQKLLAEGASLSDADLLALYQAVADLADTPGYQSFARKVVDPKLLDRTPAEARAHAYYVLARGHASAREPDKAAAALHLALAGNGVPAAFKGRPERGKAAQQILEQAIDELRAREKLTEPFKSPTDADKVLTHAAKLTQLAVAPPSPHVRATEALAAWHKTGPDAAQALKLAEAVLKDPGPANLTLQDALPLFLARAEAQKRLGQEVEALGTYREAFEYARQNKLPPLELHEIILAPALRLGGGMPSSPAARKALAALHAARGRLIEDNLTTTTWPFSDAKQEVHDAYARAFELDEQAPYLIRKAMARLELPGYVLDELRKDAERAIQLDGQYPGGFGLLGWVLFTQSRAAGDDLTTRITKLEGALKALDRAVELGAKQSPPESDHAAFLVYRSAVSVDLVSWKHPHFVPAEQALSDAEQLRYLTQARDDALAVGKIPSRRHPEYAYAALGNALEDLAWISHRDEEDNYALAVQAFDEAIRLREDLAKTWLDRGRCKYKWAEFRTRSQNKVDDSLLADAARDLESAARADRDSFEAADAKHWLAWVYWIRYRFAAADKSADPEKLYAQGSKAFQEAVALARAQKLMTTWRRWLLELAMLAEQEVARVGSNAEKRQAALKVQRDCYDTILQQSRDPDAAYRLGQTWWAAGDGEKTLEAYERGLPTDLSKLDKSHVLLIVARAEASLWGPLIIKSWPRDRVPTVQDQLQAADLAVKLTADAKADPLLRARALGTAGMARHEAIKKLELDDKQRIAYEKKAIEQLLDSIAIPGSERLQNIWYCPLIRMALDTRLKPLCEGNEEERKKYRTQMIKALQDARREATGELQGAIDDRLRFWTKE